MGLVRDEERERSEKGNAGIKKGSRNL